MDSVQFHTTLRHRSLGLLIVLVSSTTRQSGRHFAILGLPVTKLGTVMLILVMYKQELLRLCANAQGNFGPRPTTWLKSLNFVVNFKSMIVHSMATIIMDASGYSRMTIIVITDNTLNMACEI